MKQLIQLLSLLILSIQLPAQPSTFNSGLLFEDETYDALPREKTDNDSKAVLPPVVDLSPYCPPVRNQGDFDFEDST